MVQLLEFGVSRCFEHWDMAKLDISYNLEKFKAVDGGKCCCNKPTFYD